MKKKWLTDSGSLFVSISASVLLLSILMMMGVRWTRDAGRQYLAFSEKQDFLKVEGDVELLASKIAVDFLKRLNTDAAGNLVSDPSLCRLQDSGEVFLTSSLVQFGQGYRLKLLDRASLSNVVVTSNYVKKPLERCRQAETVYDTEKDRLSSLRGKTGIYWCMEMIPPEVAGSSTSKTLIEFMYVPISLQTGGALTCEDYAAQRDPNAPSKDYIVSTLYYTIYWEEVRSDGSTASNNYSSSRILGI